MKWTTPNSFRSEVINHGYDMDGYFGAQCWDGGDLFWEKQVGRRLITKPGGNGGARDCWEVSKKYNAGTEFDLITKKEDLLPGDWLIFGGTQWGHIAMAVAKSSGNTCRVLGQNQGGARYAVKSNDGSGNMVAGQGSCFNEITISLTNFLGAFRLKAFHQKEDDMLTRDALIRLRKHYTGKSPSKKEFDKYVGKVTEAEMAKIIWSWPSYKIAIQKAKDGTLDPVDFLPGSIAEHYKKPEEKIDKKAVLDYLDKNLK